VPFFPIVWINQQLSVSRQRIQASMPIVACKLAATVFTF
jgi:hypothetical protein